MALLAGTPDRSAEPERLRALWARLNADAGPEGSLRFDRFLEDVLYAPEVGYYTRPEAVLGRGGDFYTAPHASPIFGATMARRVAQEYERLGRPLDFTLVEAGPGDGSLAVDLLGALARAGTFEGRPLTHVLVERSPALAQRTLERLRSSPHPPGWRVGVHPTLGSSGPFEGVLLANELLDALPFRRLVWRGGAFRELGVHLRTGRAEWTELPFTDPPGPPALPSSLEEGQVLEVSPQAEAFVREVADHLVAGAAVVVDYGREEAELLARYPHGSLAAFRHHELLPDPLESPGSADLSAFVNFTRIRAAVARSGLRELAFESQAVALGRWGLPAVLEAAREAAGSEEERVRLQLGAKNLLFGFEQFRVLELGAR